MPDKRRNNPIIPARVDDGRGTQVSYGTDVWKDKSGVYRMVRGDQDVVWITKDGRGYYLAAMETTHIRNCVANILIRDNWRGAYMPLLTAELKRRMLDEERAANGANHDQSNATIRPGDGEA